MEQNKVRKYLLYAVGEILLVVIGILIALQVNNWNEQRKQQNRAEVALERLFEESQEIVLYFREQNGWIREYINNLDTTTKALHDGTYRELQAGEIQTSLGVYPTPSPTRHVYDELTNAGEFKEIPSTEIRNSVVDYYRSLAYLEGQIQYFRSFRYNMDELAGEAFYYTYNESLYSRRQIVLNLESLSNNREYKSALLSGLHQLKTIHTARESVLENAIHMCQAIGESIQKECTSTHQGINIQMPTNL